LVHKVASNMHFGHELANREFWITKLPRVSSLVIPWRLRLVCRREILFFSNNTVKSCLFAVSHPLYLRHFIGIVQQRKRKLRGARAGPASARGRAIGHLWPTPSHICAATRAPPYAAKEDLAYEPDRIRAATGAPPLSSSWDEGHDSHGGAGARLSRCSQCAAWVA
jgi:hypothetical protein